MPAPSWSSFPAHAERLHQAALAAADPRRVVAGRLAYSNGVLAAGDVSLPLAPQGRVFMVAFGKASPGMARAALEILGDRLAAGVVVHPHGLDPGAWPERVRTLGAAHPLPDEGSLRGGEAAAAIAAEAGPDDVVLVLVSGGGSALLESPRTGVSLADLQTLTSALQRAGADILELNAVRRALSRLKGGGLARLAHPARVLSLLLSDVMGDPPGSIASGPTVPSPTGPREALEVIHRRGVAAQAPAVVTALEAAARDPVTGAFPESHVVVVGSNTRSAEAARDAAHALGFDTSILSLFLQGEAREAGRVIGGIARSVRQSAAPAAPPACLILGGETTVTVRGPGRGGRNLELALGAALAIDGCERTAVLAFATDGMDGSSGAAGAVVRGDTLARARAAGLSAHDAFAASDTAPFFEALGDLRVTGPSGTNVNDLAIVLVY